MSAERSTERRPWRPLWVALPLSFVLGFLLFVAGLRPPAEEPEPPPPPSPAPLQRELWRRVVCVVDPAGVRGTTMGAVASVALEARDWGVDLELRPVGDELEAHRGLASGACDGLVADGASQLGVGLGTEDRPELLRLEAAAVLEAPGALTTATSLRTMVRGIGRYPGMRAAFSTSEVELAGVVSAGPRLLWTRGRCVRQASELVGQRVLVPLDHVALFSFIGSLGAQPGVLDPGTVRRELERGDADGVIIDPLRAEQLGLWPLFADQGCLLTVPHGWSTRQLVLRKGRFPEGFRGAALERLLAVHDRAVAHHQQLISTVPDHLRLAPDGAQRRRWAEHHGAFRTERKERGTYSATVLYLMRKVRCHEAPASPDCAPEGDLP